MKKIEKTLFIQPNNNYSGSCRVLLNVIQDEYSEKEYKVVTMGEEGFLSQLPHGSLVYLTYPTFFGKILHGPSYLLYCVKLFFVCLFYGFSYREFYVNTIMPFAAVLAGRVIGCKITYHVHEKFINPDAKQRLAEKIFPRVKANRIYVSNYLKEAYKDKRETSRVEYNRLSRDFLASVKMRPFSERKRNTMVLVSALPSKQKGVDLYYQLAKSCPEYIFYLITELPEEKVYAFLNAPELPNLIVKKGGREVGKYYQLSDLLINMSNPFFFRETFGMTILEGMAYGLPAIVPNSGGPKELVDDGFNGYKVDVTDIEGIKHRIKEIFKEENYETFCSNALAMFQKLNGYFM